jgi:glutamine synthetase
MGKKADGCRETFEYRAPDAFADSYLLFAGIALATRYGLENAENSLKMARDLHVKGVEDRIEKSALPCSCSEAADNLQKDRRLYEVDKIFPNTLLDKTVEKLKAYDDKDLWKNLAGKPEEVGRTLKQYLHYG